MRKLNFMSQVVCPKTHSNKVAKPIFKLTSYVSETEAPPVMDLTLYYWAVNALRRLKLVFFLILEFRSVYWNNGNFILDKQLLSSNFFFINVFNLIYLVFHSFSGEGETKSMLCHTKDSKNSKELWESSESIIKGVKSDR